MHMIFGVPLPLLFGQLLLGLINGAFYALLSLGLAVIFGMLNIINFAHGALFMLGAFVAWMLLTPNTWLAMISPGLAVPDWLSLGYWPALIISLTYAGGIALAAFAGVLAAPIYSVNPNMGSNFIITVFAVVVIGGMGSILGSIVTGFGLGIVEGLTKVYYPQASATVIFVVMVIVLLAR